MGHDCSCGETFETLTKLRLHQRDDCPDRAEEFDVDGMDVDELAERATKELLICDVCEKSNDGAESIEREITNAGVSIVATFDCDHCGAHNENTAIID